MRTILLWLALVWSIAAGLFTVASYSQHQAQLVERDFNVAAIRLIEFPDEKVNLPGASISLSSLVRYGIHWKSKADYAEFVALMNSILLVLLPEQVGFAWGPPVSVVQAKKHKPQHWRAFPGKNGWKGAPMLGFL